MKGNKALNKFEDIMSDISKNKEEWPESASFLSLETAIDKSVLSSGKLKVIKFLKENEVESMTDLAEKIDRSKKNVSNNVKELEKYGLIRTTKEGRKKIPELNEDHLFILF